MANEYLLEIKNVRKEFPGVVALDNVSLFLKKGEIHALVGENGAGKSTLMKILAGIYSLDQGEILYDGKPFQAKKPVDALEKGIAMVHQELDLIPEMTVEENVFAGREKSNGIVIDKRGMEKRTKDLMESLGIDISPKTKIKELSTAQQQMVAITRALAFDAEIIIMDEPTSAITDREVEQLFKIIRKLKAQGKAIVYISHKMDEIYSLGIDAIDAAKKSVAAGELDATVLQDVETIGQKTVEVAIEMCKGEKVDDVYNVDPVLLTKDNIADYVTE